MMFIAATCPKALLNNNYTFLKAINFWPPIVFIGIFFSSFSAALSSLIGASRVLHAMAKDGMFGPALRLMKMTNGKNFFSLDWMNASSKIFLNRWEKFSR